MKQTDPDFKPFGVLSEGDPSGETTSIRVFKWVPNPRNTTGKMRRAVVRTFRGSTNDIDLIRQEARLCAHELNALSPENAARWLENRPKSVTVS